MMVIEVSFQKMKGLKLMSVTNNFYNECKVNNYLLVD